MSAESNMALSRRVLDEAFNAGNIDVIDELVTTDFVNHDAALPEAMIGPGCRQGDHQRLPHGVPRPAHHDRAADRGRRGSRDTLERQGDASGRPDGDVPDGQAGDGDRNHHRPDRERPDRRELDELGHARDAAAARRRARPGQNR
jgi:hypothetical protein